MSVSSAGTRRISRLDSTAICSTIDLVDPTTVQASQNRTVITTHTTALRQTTPENADTE